MTEHKLPPGEVDAILRRHNGTIQRDVNPPKVRPDGSFQCRCPLPGHRDSEASFDVYVHKTREVDYFCCKGCDRKGDLLEWLKITRGLTFKDAIASLDNGAIPAPAKLPARQKIPYVVPDLGPIPEGWPLPHVGVQVPCQRWDKDEGRWITSKTFKPTYVHKYIDRHGVLIGIVIRSEFMKDGRKAKSVLPYRLGRADEKWYSTGWQKPERPPVYNEHLLARRPKARVVIVEGEKKADYWNMYLEDDRIAITCQGGKNRFAEADWSLLAGRDVLLWPDAVDGVAIMEHLAGELQANVEPASVYLVTPPADKPKGWDLVDLLDEHRDEPSEAVLSGFVKKHAKVLAVAGGIAPSRGEGPSGYDYPWLEGTGDLWAWGKDRQPIKTAEVNTIIQLSHDPRFKGRFQFDVFEREFLIDGRPAIHHHKIQRELNAAEPHLTPPGNVLARLIEGISLEPQNRVNRFADALRSLTWDGELRLQASMLNDGPKGLLPTYANVEADPFTRVIGMRWLVGIVRRVLQPLDQDEGLQHDLILVLEGDQGDKKTTFFRLLSKVCGFNVYGSMTSHAMGKDKDDMINMAGKAIIEMAELVAHKKADQESFKAFVDKTFDTYRRPYGKTGDDFPRFCGFAGSTNQIDDYLTDATGNRRILPARVKGRINAARLAADVEQIWAEAVHLALAGEQHWLTDEEEQLQKESLSPREILDPWTHTVEASLAAKIRVPVKEVISLMPELQARERNNHAVQRISQILRSLGWRKVKATSREDRLKGINWFWTK